MSAPSRRIRAQANGGLRGCLGSGSGHPGPRLHHAARTHLDQLAGVVTGGRVVLGGGDDHRAAGAPHPEELPVPQPGQEGPDHRTHRARVRVFEAVRCVQRFALGHPILPLDLVERAIPKSRTHFTFVPAQTRRGRGPARRRRWHYRGPPWPEPTPTRPNILLVVSDQERQRWWLPGRVSPALARPAARRRARVHRLLHPLLALLAQPGQPVHRPVPAGPRGRGQRDHARAHRAPTSTPTLGSLLDGAGYRSSYIGKWHLSHSPTPDMEAYGFADWDGNDRHFMGWAGTGVHFDPIIAANAAHWLTENARPRARLGGRRSRPPHAPGS